MLISHEKPKYTKMSYKSQMLEILTSLSTIILLLLDPLLFLLTSATFLPPTILSLLLRFQFLTLLSPSRFKDAWFARFWKIQGPLTRVNAMPRVKPLLEQAEGVVLEIGPGTGEWMGVYDKRKVRKIYGVEPNRDYHEVLKKRIEEAGLEEVYVIVPVGVEGLNEGGWIQGKVDTVVTVQCLCSVGDPERMIGELYGWLKEGGRWIVYEHVVAFGHQGWGMKSYQSVINIIWPHFLGGCSITKDTGKWLKEVGPWSKVDLRQPEDELKYQVLPHVMGVLAK